MVEAVRKGFSQRRVAKVFHIALSTLQHWIQRAHGSRLDRVDWENRAPVPRKTTRTPVGIEDLILTTRKELREESALGEYGAIALYQELRRQGVEGLPCVRTLGRIFRRRGALDGRRRIRWPPPPPGWYLPEVAQQKAELDSFDIIEDLKIRDGPLIDVLTGISLYGKVPGSWPQEDLNARAIVPEIRGHWQLLGLPGYAQFDNDTLFQGAHQHKDSISRVMRLCLSLSVVPVFAPPRETGFQAAIENFNGRWQSKVWQRFEHPNFPALIERSDRYIAAYRGRVSGNNDRSPARRPFPRDWEFDVQTPLSGRIIYIRRTNEHGSVVILGHPFSIDKHWLHRLVRCEVDLNADLISFYGLRRKAPAEQPCLGQIVHHVPRKRFMG